MLDFSPQLKWSFIQDLDHVRMSSCLLFQSWWAGIVSVTRVERTFPQPYGACSLWLPCNRLSVHVSALRTQCPWTAEHVGPNLQGLGLQLQVQCVWKPIWALYSLKYLFCNFFLLHELFQRRVLGSFQSHVEACSAVVSAATIPQSYPPLCPSQLTYSSFVNPVIFTYRFTLFGFQMCLF